MPLIFVGALQEAFMYEGKRMGGFSVTKDTFEKAFGFIMLNACIQTMLRWSIGYILMGKPREVIEEEERRFSEMGSTDDSKVQPPKNEFMMKVKGTVNPTLISSIIAILIASVPPLKRLFYMPDGDAPLYNSIFKAILLIGENGKAIMMLQLGCNLASISDEKISDEVEQLNKTAYTLNVVLKMLVYPFIGLAIVLPLLWIGFMYDPMQSFIVMLQIASPSAITLTVITNVHKFLEKETAKCFIYQYLASIVTVTLSSAVFLSILF